MKRSRGIWYCCSFIFVVASTVASAQQITPELKAQAAAALRDAKKAQSVSYLHNHLALSQDIQAVEKRKATELQAMYRQNLPAGIAAKVPAAGERILMFASMAMTPTDMHGLMEAALADPRVVIEFQGGERTGGVDALLHWLNGLMKGMKERPSFEINPPDFHKYHVTEVPYAIVLRNGKEVGRVGGVVSPRWIDQQLASRSGNLGDYGSMTPPSEVDMEVYLAERRKNFDWNGYIKRGVANFWRGLKMPTVPHATRDTVYMIDPTVTIVHDIRTPSGLLIAKAGTKANPLSIAPLDVTLVVIDGSDPVQRAYAKHQLQALKGTRVMVLSTTVPAKEADGWSVWSAWESDIGTNLFAYLPEMARRLQLTGTPSLVSGNKLLLKVHQVALSTTASGDN